METKRLMRSFLKVATTAFLVLLTGNAFAIENASRVVSPYWQVDTTTYTFVAVSHSSLSGMNSQIGIKISAFDNSGTSYGTAQEFTLSQNGTQRVFIIPTTHSTINTTTITDSDVTFINGTSDFTHGHIVVEPTASHPNYKYIEMDLGGGTTPWANGNTEGMRAATMLTYWGSVVVEANTTGFAMEFIGDMNDSSGGLENCSTYAIKSDATERICTNAGVNLQ